jgi:hypothetical protein
MHSCKTIIEKAAEKISVVSFDTGRELSGNTSPFDRFAGITDGSTEISINKTVHLL